MSSSLPLSRLFARKKLDPRPPKMFMSKRRAKGASPPPQVHQAESTACPVPETLTVHSPNPSTSASPSVDYITTDEAALGAGPRAENQRALSTTSVATTATSRARTPLSRIEAAQEGPPAPYEKNPRLERVLPPLALERGRNPAAARPRPRHPLLPALPAKVGSAQLLPRADLAPEGQQSLKHDAAVQYNHPPALCRPPGRRRR